MHHQHHTASQQQTGQTSQQIGQGSQQTGQGSQQTNQGIDQRYTDVETPQQREALQSILRAVEVCEWCADQCIQEANPMMVECIRLCEDVAELGETAITLVPRQSRFANSVLQTFIQAARACGQECSQHSHNHCQECSQVLREAVDAVQQYLSSTGQHAGQGTQQMAGTGTFA